MLELLEKAKNLDMVFQAYGNIACVYVFGSCVKGFSTTDSDIDFAILIRDGNFRDRAFLAYKIEKALDFVRPVELIVLNHQKLIFKLNVIKDGKIVYEADRNYRVRFETDVMRQFHELEPHFQFMEKYYSKGLLRRLGYETT